MVTVIASKDPPEVFNKRLEEAVKRFYIAVQKEQKEKAPTPTKVESANLVDM